MNPGSVILEMAGDFRALAVDAFRELWKRRGAVLVFAVTVILVALAVYPADTAIDHRLTDQRPDGVARLARQFSYWGDFPTGTLILSAAFWLGGLLLRRRSWRIAGVACILAATLAGLSVNVLRPTLGRARPYAEEAGTFRGPSMKNAYHGFPSAHSATAFGTATALAVTVPAVGVPALAAAGGVAWSRMYTRNHFLSDVLVGSSVGILFGLAVGLAARRQSLRDR